MREVAVEHLREGMRLAMPIYNLTGALVLKDGVDLGAAHIRRIADSGASSAWIDDRFAEDLKLSEVVRPELRPKAAQLLADLYDVVRRKAFEKEAPKYGRECDALITTLVEDVWAARDAAITIFGSRSLPEYELTHPFNAAMLTVLLGLGTGCDSRTLKRLGLIALLQNIGQALVPESTLLAPRPLTPEERKAVQQHSLVGAQLVRHFYEFDAVMVATVQQHHERMDGSGYPAGLSGRNVLNMARAVAIADAYDALISQRPYRGPYARQEAIEFIMAFAGELFDLPLAEKFARSVPAYLPGTIVRLDNGEKGIIINSNRGLVGRPVVRVCYGADGRELTLPREIDLAKAENQSRLVAAVLPDWE